ncbi:putative ATP-grasp superfamily ATP-dependent carboligase [Salana multivorans]|uniref:Putative ATP-grasp superfamily ATP-dependent carboligase n=1 Tax=Salana multivorans TaxID=120377 RepID=A0A3N2D249_9MICO|nr:PAC2 family protein [Salana multivorans]MBN8881320.1 PAC2 family protein [Salana multivorans]ROR93856.1 putative ATP-grasp superfamily ATP-dependent carboligase [Salana multivorans]
MEPSALFTWNLPAGTPAGTPQLPTHHGVPAVVNEESEDAGLTLPTTLDEVEAPVLVHAMRGAIDAGHAGALVAGHLLAAHPTRRVATFDVEELLDYRSRRPVVTFDRTAYTDYATPQLALDYVATADGGMLLLHGVEPDLRWETFSTAVREIVERLGVRTTVALQGIPMGVPHTRPVSVTEHATREDLVEPAPELFGTVQVPGTAASLLELRLGEHGHDAMGFAVHVPHYLAQTEYPAAAAELLRRLARVTELPLDTGALDRAAGTMRVEIDRQVAEAPEVASLVSALEQQYDAYVEAAGKSLLAGTHVPSADEIGAQFEAFLAAQAGEDSDDDGDGSLGGPHEA